MPHACTIVHNCSSFIDQYVGALPHLTQRVGFVAIAKAPPPKLRAVIIDNAETQKAGWADLRVFSACDTSFNEDLGVSFAPSSAAETRTYNFNRLWSYGTEAPGSF